MVCILHFCELILLEYDLNTSNITGSALVSVASSSSSSVNNVTPPHVVSTSPVRKTPTRTKHVSAIKESPTISPALLSKFKFSSAKNTSRSSSKDSILRAVRIVTPHPYLIFRCAVPGQSAYSEKVWNDDIRAGAPWTVALNFEKRLLRWCHDGNEQQNANGYAIRLFVIPLEEIPPDDAIFEMAQYICDNLNANVSNFTTTSYNKSDFFWIQEPTTWQNVISTSTCLDRLFSKCGQPSGTDWWDTHAAEVKTYFAPGSINEHLARRLYAPATMVHGLFPQVDDDGEHDSEDEEEEEEEDDEDEEDGTERDPDTDKIGHAMDKDPFHEEEMEF